MNNDILKEVSTSISEANNVLVAVSTNPSVDELSAAVGLTLLLNSLGKHATTVFSGVVPSTLEFLQPEQAIETTTDSLRDFIIALDKSKADKLRYKVEDDVVRIFITPYKTTISDADLDFSLGEFNVDVVVAIGISRRDDVDQAVTAHGRILHDATVLALTNKENSDFGSINWNEPQASSLSEMVSAVAYSLSSEKIDGQMATALLTGIIAETDRFRNESTTPQSLDFASRLMRAGANQQLIADELEAAVKLQETNSMPVAEELPVPHDAYNVPQPLDHKEDDGSLQIDHEEPISSEPVQGEMDDPDVDNIHIDHHGNLSNDVSDSDESSQFSDAPSPMGTYLTDDEPKEKQEESAFDGAPQQVGSQPEGPTLTHGKTIQPIHEPEFPTTPNQPFDAQKAIEEMQAEQQVPEPEAEAPVSSAQELVEQARQPEPQQQATAPAPVFEEQLGSQIPQPVITPEPAPEPTPEAEQPVPTPVESQHEQTLQDLEKAVNSPHVVDQQISSDVPQPVETPDPAPEPTPEVQLPSPATQEQSAQPVDTSSVPQPLTEENEQNANTPPPVPPPMQPQFFDNNSSGQ